MTTKGKALRRHDAFLTPIGLDGEDEPLHELVNIVRRLEEIRGEALVIDLEPPVPEHTQRLYATLGVLVRFVTLPTEQPNQEEVPPCV